MPNVRKLKMDFFYRHVDNSILGKNPEKKFGIYSVHNSVLPEALIFRKKHFFQDLRAFKTFVSYKKLLT
jgi:hypothetical protein